MVPKRILFLTPLFFTLMFFTAAAAQTATTQPPTTGAGLTPKQQVGKSIFFDQHLSINQNQACAACHSPEVGGTGANETFNGGGGVYEGSIAGRFGARKPPASAYAALSPVFHFRVEEGEILFMGGNFWDGRATGEKLGNPAADQAQGPFLNPLEQALPDSACVVYRVCNPSAPSDYPVKLQDVFGANICRIDWPKQVQATCAQEGVTVALSAKHRQRADLAYDKIALAIAAYEASPEVNAFTSKYDYYLAGKVKLTSKERKGLSLFEGKAQCANCHTLTPGFTGEPLLTDFTYDNIGVPKNPANPVYAANPAFVDYGLGDFLTKRPEYAQYAADNMGKHKVPTLRNVDLRPTPNFVKAYMHNGYFKTLEGVVHFYNTRDTLPACPSDLTEAQALAQKCWPAPEVATNLNRDELGNLDLSRSEEAAVVAFMRTLSDGYVITAADLQGNDSEEPVEEESDAEAEAVEEPMSQQLYLPAIFANNP
ncbi:MAG: cytochrome c peroxidase [Caldilineaceae bacterium]